MQSFHVVQWQTIAGRGVIAIVEAPPVITIQPDELIELDGLLYCVSHVESFSYDPGYSRARTLGLIVSPTTPRIVTSLLESYAPQAIIRAPPRGTLHMTDISPTDSSIPTRRRAILCDIDGTIALRGTRDPYDFEQAMEDTVNWPIVHLIEQLLTSSPHPVSLILLSGRQEQFRDITEYWLFRHQLFPTRHSLWLRLTGDPRPDVVVKEELFHRIIAPEFHVEYVFDDRNTVVAMWRRLGLTCLQVADGAF